MSNINKDCLKRNINTISISMKNIWRTIRNLAFLYLVALFFFLYGAAVGGYKVFPWEIINKYYQEIYAYLTFKDGQRKTNIEKILLDHQENESYFGSERLGKKRFELLDPSFKDDGYLLISRYDKVYKQVIIELFSLEDEKVIHRWVPPLKEIISRSPDYPSSVMAYRAQHPLLLADGGLVFTSGEGPLVKIDDCGKIVWVINRHFHHSIELDHNGNFVVPIIVEGKKPTGDLAIRDDGFAVVSPQGEILKEYSVTDILIKKRLIALLFGIGKFEEDRIHLNDAQPILKTIGSSRKGDVALSSRHLSSVFLFSQETGTIKWLKPGPWLNQHDINQLQDGSFSIFGNNIVRTEKNQAPLMGDKISDIYIFNPDSGTVITPFFEMMKKHNIVSKYSGRSRILENGDVYVEESDKSRLLRLSTTNIRWEYVNIISDSTVGAVHWSRYISAKDINLTWKENLQCK